MILAIDGYEANVQHRVGIGRYAYDLLVCMHRLIGSRPYDDVTVRVYLPGPVLPDMPAETDRWRYITRTPGKLWTFIALPMALLLDRPSADVVFSPTHYSPRFVSVPRVMSVMDLSYLYFPELFRKKDLYQLTNWTKYSVLHAKAVCTISEFSKNDIIKRYQINPSRVHVTYPGLSMRQEKDTKRDTEVLRTYNAASPYLLSVGTIQPRKNFEKLIEAYSILASEKNSAVTGMDLIIIGKHGWLTQQILQSPKKYGVEHRVKFLDFVPDADMPVFYRNAEIFVLPSLYEGFGLPVLEAMAYNVPVVVSNSSSLPEIAGEAGVYVDPLDVGSIAGGIRTALRERTTLKGKKRIEKGVQQIKKFTWDAAARQTLDILMRTAAEGRAA